MYGMMVSDPSGNALRRSELTRLLHNYDLPLECFTEEPAEGFAPGMTQVAFLRTASWKLLIPEQPLPMESLLAHIPGAPLAANVLRRHLFLRMSLMPYLRPGRKVTQLTGCFLLGDNLLIAPVSPEDTADAQLPPGVWTELNGACHEGRLRTMRGYNETPVLVRENTLLPVSMNGQSLTQTTDDDTDRLTLHWFQPAGEAECSLADGTRYHVQRVGERIVVCTDTNKVFHLVVHENGVEHLIQV